MSGDNYNITSHGYTPAELDAHTFHRFVPHSGAAHAMQAA